MRNSISGFTIMELLVGMIISSIILTLIWNIYFILGDYQNLIETKSEKVIALEKLKYLLVRDFERAQSVETLSSNMTIFGASDTIDYVFSSREISRWFSGYRESIPIGGYFETYGKEEFKVCFYVMIEDEVCMDLQLRQSVEVKINAEL